jgi:hypothetical protein
MSGGTEKLSKSFIGTTSACLPTQIPNGISRKDIKKDNLKFRFFTVKLKLLKRVIIRTIPIPINNRKVNLPNPLNPING